MRLEAARGNWPRVRVGSRKINRVYLKEKDSADLKLRYYDLIVQLALQDDSYLEVCSAYQEVWDTEEIKADEARELDVSHKRMRRQSADIAGDPEHYHVRCAGAVQQRAVGHAAQAVRQLRPAKSAPALVSDNISSAQVMGIVD